ncbi:MAG: pyrimidine dimer DNA glycosylase/endonuclease V [Microgenomates group bacterium]
MRIWSLHPQYLDTKGLVALWREGLLALAVLSGRTKGYTKHPQLQRFQEHESPIGAIANYLHFIVDEAAQRNYNFDRQKLLPPQVVPKIYVTSGQLEYECNHLKAKLRQRDPVKLLMLEQKSPLLSHPFFEVTEGEVESWEKI